MITLPWQPCHLPPLLYTVNLHTCQPFPFCFIHRSLDSFGQGRNPDGELKVSCGLWKASNVGEKHRTPLLLTLLVLLQPHYLPGHAPLPTSARRLPAHLVGLLVALWGCQPGSQCLEGQHTPSHLAPAGTGGLCDFPTCPNTSGPGML